MKMGIAKSSKKTASYAKESKKKTRTKKPTAQEISSPNSKKLLKAPGNYEEIARKFADALETTRFRGVASPAKIRTLVARGEQAARRARAFKLRAEATDRQRIVAESKAWKAVLSTWRMIVA